MTIEINHLSRPPAQGLANGPSAGASRHSPHEHQAPAADSVQITDAARQIQALTDSLDRVPVVDVARVTEVRQALAEGRYEVHPERIAEKLLDMERALAGLK